MADPSNTLRATRLSAIRLDSRDAGGGEGGPFYLPTGLLQSISSTVIPHSAFYNTLLFAMVSQLVISEFAAPVKATYLVR